MYSNVIDWSLFKAFAGDINTAQIINIPGKGENAGYQHFILFPTMFSIAAIRISKNLEKKPQNCMNFIIKGEIPFFNSQLILASCGDKKILLH